MSVELRFVCAMLATWRLTHLLSAEDGPGDIVVHLRARLGDTMAGRAMDCVYCLSIWIAAPLALFVALTLPIVCQVWLLELRWMLKVALPFSVDVCQMSWLMLPFVVASKV